MTASGLIWLSRFYTESTGERETPRTAGPEPAPDMKGFTATIVKVLHGYGDTIHEETMRFATRELAAEYAELMTGKRVEALFGSAYTVREVRL